MPAGKPARVVQRPQPKQSLFMSYASVDDKSQEGQLTEFRERLSAEIRAQTGKDYSIFQDRIHIQWGDNWQQRITEALDEVFFLIPIITPSFFNSPACRAELEYFLEREKRLHREDLIFPIYYIGRELLSNPKKLAQDKLIQAIASRQYADWREMRFEPFTSPPVAKALAQLASQIGDALERASASADSTQRDVRDELAMSASPPASSAVDVPYSEYQLIYLRQRSYKNEPLTLVVDQMQSGDYSSINEAIEAANAGDRIVILPGVYEEGIVIDKPLEIIGMGRLEKIVVRATGQNAISFKTTFGRVVNLTLEQIGDGDWFGVDIPQGRLELEGCDISSQGSSCVAVHGGADPRIRRNQIHGGKATGIIIYDNAQGTLEDNEIFGTALAGVAITNGGNPTLRKNRIHDCEREGIMIYDKAQGIIEDNSIYGNTFSGVEIKVDSTPLLRRNRIYNGKAGGVYIHQNAQGMLEDNDIFGNSLAGVAIKTGANPTLRRNFIHDGKRSGIFINEDGEGMIEDNDIFGNGYSGVEIKTGGNPTVRYNRIKDNRHLGIWIGERAGGTINNNDLRSNGQGAFYVSTDSEPKIKRNLEE